MGTEPEIIAADLRITGRVQGVAYRAWMRARARARGLTGWVRNNPDGSVSAHVEGPREEVLDLATECRSGPGAASVRDVQCTLAPPTGGFADFRITG